MSDRSSPSPRDPYNVVFFLFYYLAIGTLLPWNFFINVNSYWMYKFRTVDTGNTSHHTFQDPLQDQRNDLQLQFTSALAIAAMIPNVTFLVLNGFFGHRFPTTPRLLVALCSVVVLFIFALVLVKVDTDQWQMEFLALTLAIVVVINIFASIFQGGLFGMAGRFPPKYMNAVLSGQGIGGVFAATINIILLAAGGDGVTAAFYCFLLSVVFLLGSVLAIVMAMRSEFFTYYMEDSTVTMRDSSVTRESLTESTPLITQQQGAKVVSVLSVLRSIWCETLTIFIIYVVTLGCFPGLTVLVESTNKNQPGSTAWENQFFVPVACFLFYNIGDYIGRFLAASPMIPTPPPVMALLLAIVRVVMVPLLLVCNLAPQERTLTPVLLSSDGAFIGIIFALSISNGWLTSVVMVAAPSSVPSYAQQAASNLMVATLGLGLVTGSAISAGLVQLL